MHKLGQGLALAAMIALVGCTAKSPVLSNPTTTGTTATGTTTTTVQSNLPVVSSFSPKSGGAGTVVTIMGSGFDASVPTNNTVLFNGVPGVVNSATSTMLTATVPPGASFGTLKVIVDGRTAVSADTYSPNWRLSTIAGTMAPQGIPALGWQDWYGYMAKDAHGNLYVTAYESVLYKISPDGKISTIAGNGEYGNSGDGGPATQARLGDVVGVAVDAAGNVYLSDDRYHVVRKIDPSGTINTVAGVDSAGYAGDGGPAASAMLNTPEGLAVDAAGDLYIADSRNQVIREINATTHVITTVAGNHISGFSGDGSAAASASIANPQSMAVDATGDLFIADNGNQVVREVNATTGVITTVAGTPGTSGYSGDGSAAASASLSQPCGIALDATGNLFIADSRNQVVREVNATTHVITTVAGNNTSGFSGDGAAATSAQLNYPIGVLFDAAGNLLIADDSNEALRKVDTQGNISTFAGAHVPSGLPNGPALGVQLWNMQGMAEDAHGALYVASPGSNAVFKISNGTLTTFAGGSYGYAGDGGAAASASLNNPYGVAVDATGNLYIADGGNQIVRKVDTTGTISTIAGSPNTRGSSGDGGPATSALLNGPSSVTVDATGDVLIADSTNHRIREVNASTGVITTLAGNGNPGFSGDGGPATSAALVNPSNLVLDSAGNVYFIDGIRVRRIDTHGVISTVAGNGVAQSFKVFGFSLPSATGFTLSNPGGLAVDPAGNVYVSDVTTRKIFRISAADGTIEAIAGDGTNRYAGDGSTAVQSGTGIPGALLWSQTGRLLFTDTYHAQIRAIGY